MQFMIIKNFNAFTLIAFIFNICCWKTTSPLYSIFFAGKLLNNSYNLELKYSFVPLVIYSTSALILNFDVSGSKSRNGLLFLLAPEALAFAPCRLASLRSEDWGDCPLGSLPTIDHASFHALFIIGRN